MAGKCGNIGNTAQKLAFQVHELQRVKADWANPAKRQKIHKEINRLAYKVINENEYIEARFSLARKRADLSTPP